MATHDKPKREDPLSYCDGCGLVAASASSGQVRNDSVTGKHLCNKCWSEVDPRHFGVADPERLSPREKRL